MSVFFLTQCLTACRRGIRFFASSKWPMMWLAIAYIGATCAVGAETAGSEADWPMWRYDASRSGTTPRALPEQLHLQWVRKMRHPAPAWPEEQYKLQFDASYEPVVMGHLIFVPSMVADNLTAYDTRSGVEKWRFYCDGPVRFAPVAWNGKVCFVSDDGYLYCLSAMDGTLVWKLRLGPSDRKVLGNGRVISTWPARGAPVLFDGKIYCAASIWPFMGVFIYAIDAESGDVVWENSGSASQWTTQQHNSPAFGAVAPQGYFAATEDKLLIPSRTTPACFDRQTGELIYYRLDDRAIGKHVGGYNVAVRGNLFFNNGVMHRLSDGEGIVKTSVQVVSEDQIIAFDADGELVGYLPEEIPKDHLKKDEPPIKARALWKAEFGPAISRVHLRAADTLYASNDQGVVGAIDIPQGGEKASISWSYRVKGPVWSMLAGDDRLFVVTTEGLLYCFGAEQSEPKWHGNGDTPSIEVSRQYRRLSRRILEQAAAQQGYCVLLGADDGGLLRALLTESQFHIIVVDEDAERVKALRREMDDAHLYGSRVSILVGDVASVQLPAYLASLIVAQDVHSAGLAELGASVQKVYDSLRPYGGMAWLGVGRNQRARLVRHISGCELANSEIDTAGRTVLLRRIGALPGSGDWIGQYGDPANTVVSTDQLKGPLGLLWFGDDSQFTDVLPRHGHGPPEQVVGGRLFIEGIDSLSARDVYTGRALWKTYLKSPSIYGVYYDESYNSNHRDLSYNQEHIPGANTRGTNFIALEDKVYIVDGAKCRVLNAATGENVTVFSLPQRDGDAPARWAYISVYEDYLIAGADFVEYVDLLGGNTKKLDKWLPFFDVAASERLVVMNRHTGEVLWTLDAGLGFIHNAIAVGDGRIFCIDGLPQYIRKLAKTRKIEVKPGERLFALDIRDGSVVWEESDCVFGTWLGYSQQRDILLQAYRKSKDMVPEAGDRMATHKGSTGDLLWDKKISYDGPCLLYDDKIITQGSAYGLLTGEQLTRQHPLTGEPVAWEYSRNYGCNTAVGSQNLLTFRSAAAGYFDLAGDGGTGNFGGFKSGCTSNLIVANGVLNAPEYTRTCTCSYQNQTSLALVHMPAVETWTFNSIKAGTETVKRVGINFGAPGDRKADNGTLWLDYPSVGGPSPAVTIDVLPKEANVFRQHSSRIESGNLKWVEASGLKGATDIDIKVAPRNGDVGSYTVRLHFAEPDEKAEGQRVFDVMLEGRTVLPDFDIVKEAGARNVGIVREFRGIEVETSVRILLTPKTQDSETLICGIEVIQE